VASSADLAHVGGITAPADRPADTVGRWSRFSGRQTAWLAAFLIVILSALVVPPFLFLLQGSVTIAGPTMNTSEWGFGNFEAVLRSRHFITTSVNSLVFAAASAMLALVIGWVTAWIVERTNTPLKGLAYLTSIISLGTPYILYVSAWLLFFGKAGPVNHFTAR
jgi:iron(III) transport system permease protein